MAISLKVLAPNKNVFEGVAEEVILPSTTGQLGILPGHISLVTAIDIGVLRLRSNSQWSSIALMGFPPNMDMNSFFDNVYKTVQTLRLSIDK